MVPNKSIRLRNPSTRSNEQIVATFRDKTNQDKSTKWLRETNVDSE